MTEYIEREALLQDIEESVCFTVKAGTISNEMRGANKIIDRIKCAPAADVEPVRHAHWNYRCPIDGNSYRYCSKCLSAVYDSVLYVSKNYCPNCGAIMDEVVSE